MVAQAPTKKERRKRKAKRRERSSLLTLDLKDGRLYDSGEEEGKILLWIFSMPTRLTECKLIVGQD